MFDIDSCIGFITNKASKKIAEVFNDRLMSYGITRVQWIALYYLLKDGKASQKELADKMNIKESTIVRLIDRLEKEKYVERVKEPENRRITYIILTDSGKNRITELIPEGEKMKDSISKGITDEEFETFNRVLQKMIDNIS
ncbi:MarR family winged helix-turn-helix transcriptional regulator [Clostridium omnivorum]|uniref:MarR family transcriptional regulator n=1 Tax=Clostridium omnivorum TaxID=1604902 RepID=A0ABQ5N8J8_9CLOT|nr:MarR family transcriptional regulator [Clostridium sp. E14]GLC31572.1 MarR family transcriptional regulator [Clostridium sp. E14]